MISCVVWGTLYNVSYCNVLILQGRALYLCFDFPKLLISFFECVVYEIGILLTMVWFFLIILHIRFFFKIYDVICFSTHLGGEFVGSKFCCKLLYTFLIFNQISWKGNRLCVEEILLNIFMHPYKFNETDSAIIGLYMQS